MIRLRQNRVPSKPLRQNASILVANASVVWLKAVKKKFSMRGDVTTTWGRIQDSSFARTVKKRNSTPVRTCKADS